MEKRKELEELYDRISASLTNYEAPATKEEQTTIEDFYDLLLEVHQRMENVLY